MWMLSIGKIALGQHRYYERQVADGRDDYYSGKGEARGAWVGEGSRALGLGGPVSAEQFNALIAGSDPRDPDTRLRSSGVDPKVAALDLTFSAPKSVSVLAAVSSNEIAGELILAHEEALRAAITYLEDTAVLVRRGHGGEKVQPGEGLIAGAYRHRMSRALDPQLHTHVVAANLTRGPDGRYTALHAAPLYRAAKTAGYLYQAHLRALVSERLGLEWGEVRKGAAELDAIPELVLVEFSKRRQEMIAAADRGGIGLETKAAGEAAALATRDRKQYDIDTRTWLGEVRARAAELGLGREEIEELLIAGEERLYDRKVEGVDEHALAERLVGESGLTERSNTFDERAVLQEFAEAARQGASVEEVREQAERFIRREDVLRTIGGEFTTAELVATERRLITAAVGRGGEAIAIVHSALTERVIARAARPLTAEQAEAVRTTVSHGAGVTVIQALAGTGKTYTAGVLRKVYERAGYAVIGVAPTGRAARELTEEAGIPARTIDRLLIDLEQLGDELPTNCVLILDEAGMAPTRSSARLLEAAEHAGAKVIAIGDPGQLSSVQAGGWLAAVGRELGSLRLTEVMRQRDPAERTALAALHDGVPKRYLDWAEHAGRIETFSDSSAAQAQAISEWERAGKEVGPTQAVMIAGDNYTRQALNSAARELWGALGLLGESHSYGPVEIAVGDRVICRHNDRLVDVDNGMRGTVRHADGDCVVIDTDSGLVRELPGSYVADHVEHAYALTGHGMQGGTVQAAVVVATPRDLTAGWSYTALSRARGETRLLIHDNVRSAERREFAPTGQAQRTERDDILARVERRMLERDDEDLAVERLPGAGRADDHELAEAKTVAHELPQERAAALAEPIQPGSATATQLRELSERIECLKSQLRALPIKELKRIDSYEERLRTASTGACQPK
jgi:conjugative relaxase-like TrwC/TraI family protein